MERIELDRIGSATNATVVRLPERRFPGIVIQGDSLHNICKIVDRLNTALVEGRPEDAQDEAGELQELLNAYKRAYEDALSEEHMDLPYVRR